MFFDFKSYFFPKSVSIMNFLLNRCRPIDYFKLFIWNWIWTLKLYSSPKSVRIKNYYVLTSCSSKLPEPRWLCADVSRNVLHPWVDACEFNSACRRPPYMAAIFRYCFVYMFVRLLRLSIFKRLKILFFIIL